MGTNYYIYIIIHEVKFEHRICHIGLRNCLDFISMYNFFKSFEIETDNFYRLDIIHDKLIDNELTEVDVMGFSKLLCDLYTECTNDLFICKDEYGNIKTFDEIITYMSNGNKEFITYNDGDYKVDGHILSRRTGFS
jgi:hypothetical protein